MASGIKVDYNLGPTREEFITEIDSNLVNSYSNLFKGNIKPEPSYNGKDSFTDMNNYVTKICQNYPGITIDWKVLSVSAAKFSLRMLKTLGARSPEIKRKFISYFYFALTEICDIFNSGSIKISYDNLIKELENSKINDDIANNLFNCLNGRYVYYESIVANITYQSGDKIIKYSNQKNDDCVKKSINDGYLIKFNLTEAAVSHYRKHTFWWKVEGILKEKEPMTYTRPLDYLKQANDVILLDLNPQKSNKPNDEKKLIYKFKHSDDSIYEPHSEKVVISHKIIYEISSYMKFK